MNTTVVFSGLAVTDLKAAKTFYTETLGLKLTDEQMGLNFQLPGGGALFIYEKPDHQPANFTVLNVVVPDIDQAVDELESAGVTFEHYEDMNQDEAGIARGRSVNLGPDIAWFKDPAGNILSVLQN